MIVVRVELHSAITGKVKEIARMDICNVGGGSTRAIYSGKTYRGRNRRALANRVLSRAATVANYPRQAVHVWNLVGLMLGAMGYGTTGWATAWKVPSKPAEPTSSKSGPRPVFADEDGEYIDKI